MAVIAGVDTQHFSCCEVLTATYQIDTSHQTPLITFITSLIMRSCAAQIRTFQTIHLQSFIMGLKQVELTTELNSTNIGDALGTSS